MAPSPTRALNAIVVVGAVLRAWWILGNGFSFDESFTAMASRRSVGALFTFLRDHDSHPPLDYLIRAPFAAAGADAAVMRLPSFVFSVAALGLFAWWMRDRGRVGILAALLIAVSPFQIMYGGEARMYALLELLGIAAAVLADRWLRRPQSWHAWAIGVVTLLALFDHVSGLLLGAGLLAVAGLRRDRAAWRWRAALAAAGVVWAACWGPSFLQQQSVTHASWIARTSVAGVVDAVGSLVTATHGFAAVIALAVGAGAVVLWRRDPVLGRVWVACALVPFVLAAVIGLFAPFFIDRTVTVAAWAPAVAIAVLLDAVFRRSHVVGVAVAIGAFALVVPGTLVFLGRTWEYDASIEHLQAVARPGDVVAAVPAWYGPLIEWRIAEPDTGGVHAITVSGLGDAEAVVLGARATNHRAWVLSFSGDHQRFLAFARCAPDWTDGVTTVSCLRLPARGDG